MQRSRGYRLNETCKSQGFIKEKASKIIVDRMFGLRCILYLLMAMTLTTNTETDNGTELF